MNAIILRRLAIFAAVGAALAGAPAVAETGLSAQTKKNLEAAMHGEAYAYLKYLAYAESANKNGHPDIAKVFAESANVEANEHFAREAAALGLVKGDDLNLADAVAGEQYENTKMYIDFAKQADADGDKKAADLFRQIAADEGEHYNAYKAALEKLKAATH